MSEHRAEIEGIDTFFRREGDVPLLYLHGNPNSSDEWLGFLERTGGIAPDLPGFGRSGKPASFDYSIAGYDRWIESFIDHLGLDRFSMVAHDWGGVGVATAQRLHERLDKLVVMSVVPMLPGYEWHRWGKIWRTPFVGEMAMGLSQKWMMRRELPEGMADEVWPHFDHGTQRAVLKLYRSADPDVIARAGENLGAIDCPALVVWPDSDPYIGAEFGPAYAKALGNAELRMVEGAGHWPWIDRPELVDEIAAWLR